MALTQPFNEYLAGLASTAAGLTSMPALDDDGNTIAVPVTTFNVLVLGAVADYDAGDPESSTDNTEAFQRAFTRAQATGGKVKVPAGKYYFAQSGASLDPGVGGFSVVGEYGSSVLYFHEGNSGTPKQLIYNATNDAAKTFLYFHGVTFKGTFGQAGRETGSNYTGAIFLDHYQELKFSYCQWKNIYCMATDTHFNQRTSFDHCTFVDVAADGARMRESFYGSVTNCHFERLGDDNIAFHGGKYVSTDNYDPDDGSPRREGLIATGNTFRDTATPISALAARQVIIAGNNANRYRTTFARVSYDTAEGTHPAGNIKIVDNIGLNCIGSSGGIVIVGAFTPRGTTESGNVIPGNPAVTTGAFEYIWDYQNADSQVAADAFPPIENVDVSRNTFARSLPAVPNYSDWGYGAPGSTTFNDDYAVADADLRIGSAINLTVGRVATVKDNTISHTTEGIVLIYQSGVTPVMLGGDISGNIITDVLERSIYLSGVSGELVNVKINNNTIDGDHYRLSSNSNADGTYDNGFAAPTAISLGSSYGAQVGSNRISNVARVTDATMDQHVWSDNTLVCQPLALGSDASNKGIRNIPEPEWGFKYIIADCDPTSATYGDIVSMTVQASSILPASGWYPKGWETKKIGPSVTSDGTDDYLITGWRRIATGTGHVLNTDWVELQTLTGT
jgi:hypothetical protein